MTLQITDATLDEVLQTDKLVVIDFWADGAACKMIGPIIDEIGKEYQDRVVVGKVDVDINDEATSVRHSQYTPSCSSEREGGQTGGCRG